MRLDVLELICFAMAMPPKMSICILACNEADRIEHTLKSAKAAPWCDEILVFDSGSTDDTVEIVKRYTDRVQYEPWVNFGANRQKLVAAASNDWVLILHADEEVSPELINEIQSQSDRAYEDHPVMTMPRKNYMLGRHVRAWDPDRIDRLFDRTRVTWPDRLVHDYRELEEGTIKDLKHAVIHNAHSDSCDVYFDGRREEARADALAREMYDQGKRCSFLDIWLRPILAYLKFYFVKRSILDGRFGVMVAQKAAFGTQIKYARLYHLQQQGGQASQSFSEAGEVTDTKISPDESDSKTDEDNQS